MQLFTRIHSSGEERKCVWECVCLCVCVCVCDCKTWSSWFIPTVTQWDVLSGGRSEGEKQKKKSKQVLFDWWTTLQMKKCRERICATVLCEERRRRNKKKQSHRCKSKDLQGEGPSCEEKIHTTNTHTTQKEPWLYVTEKQKYKHFYTDLNYSRQSMRLITHTHTHTHTQQVKLKAGWAGYETGRGGPSETTLKESERGCRDKVLACWLSHVIGAGGVSCSLWPCPWSETRGDGGGQQSQWVRGSFPIPQ